MLASMRTTANSFFMKALMLLLVLSFAVWGVGDIVRSGNNGHLVKVGSETVSYPAFARAVSDIERMMQSMGLGSIDRTMLEDQTLRRLVEEKLVAQRLEDAGLEVNQALLVDRLKKAPLFHDVRGQFDPAMFRATLAQRNSSEAMYLNELGSDIRSEVFTATLATNDIALPAAVANLYATGMSETRDAAVVTIAASSVAVDAPTESALKEYYNSNKEMLYLSPEKRTLEYVTFSRADLEKQVADQVTEQALRERYESENQEKSFEESKNALKETLTAELTETVSSDITVQVEDALAAGNSMGEAIAAVGLQAKSTLLRDVTAEPSDRTGVVVEAIRQGFSMEEGETSSIQATADGNYYMVSVRTITGATPKPYDAVAKDVATRVAQREKAKAVREKAAQVQAALAQKNWQQALAELNLRSRTVTGIRRPEIGSTPALPAVMAEAIFQHDVGGVAGPLTQENGDALVAKITASALPATPPLPTPKTTEALNKEMQQEVLQEYYRALTARYPVRLNEPLLKQIRSGQEGA